MFEKNCMLCVGEKRDLDQASGYMVIRLDPPAGHAVLLLSFVMHCAAILNNLG